MSRPVSIGLALSGGAARGIAHAGVLEVLVEAGIPVGAVAGTSAGAIVGALFAAGIPPAGIGRLALETRWSDFFTLARPQGGLLSGEGLERFLARALPVPDFASCRLPFVAVATDLAAGTRVDLAEGSLARAVRASCAIPLLFEPVESGDRQLVDGGVASQLPVRAARRLLGAGPVVAVDVNLNGLGEGRCRTAVEVAVRLAQLWAARAAREEAPLADALVAVDARGIALHDLDRGADLLERGRTAARAQLGAIRALLSGR